ncbi:hypothetical protein SAICODRAFT_26256 [Saitoella complicata NRRL Y-17804]|uniref:uncharacterized protein n=1 Tax=Saitoella complicata (strain BCRC 22490 / CBS 7301 / JCM 7358 / NBRC 10748 / NRRL Y-17804) TaxID=698492 RepID=UPI000867E7E5|nr:uncharacterized protein SAICODRAFT_26256 [Saitoella complicata NRRL Y-17804]ODQ52206.1 hypothetical protein SAICODRAFT_26256 [Saitoella complicata NRRL Y-17804]
MASEARLFALSTENQKSIRDFRLKGSKKGTACLIFSISKTNHDIIPDSATEDGPLTLSSIEELADELPDNTPRFVLLSYELEFDDGRKSTPLCMLYWAPRTSSLEMTMLYASARVWFAEKCDTGKVLECRDGDDLTDEWVKEQLM